MSCICFLDVSGTRLPSYFKVFSDHQPAVYPRFKLAMPFPQAASQQTALPLGHDRTFLSGYPVRQPFLMPQDAEHIRIERAKIAPPDTKPLAGPMAALVGYLCAAVAVLFFGSNFAVVAKYDAGDGMFFQLVLCLGIWFTGLVVLLLRSNPTFYPVAMTGGVLWCSGNCLTVYIIKQIGLGPGLVTWGTAALIIGWEQSCLEKPWLNVVGVVLAMCALGVSTLVRKSTPQKPLLIDAGRVPPTISEDVEESPARASAGRAKGVLASLVAGTCYGLNFLPSTWIQTLESSSSHGLLCAGRSFLCLHRRLAEEWRLMRMTSRAYQVSATVPGGHPDVREVKPEQLSPSGRQVVLVMTGGGGQDVPWPEQLAMEGIGRPLHVLVVTGRNEEFKTRLEHALTNSTEFNDGRVVLQGNDANVTVEVAQEPGHRGGACACVLSLPEKNHPPNATYLTAERLVLLMDIADAIITKPGGGTTAEISYRGLPAVFDATRGLLHWEEFTVHAFEQQGRGERFVWPQQLGQVLSTALKRPRSSSLVEDPANPGHVLNPGPRIVAEAEKLMEVPCHQCKLFSDNADNA
eukprot:s2555_g12.t2